MRKNTNWTKIEGRIYQHNLEIKQVKNQESANFGKDFISGTIEVAVDDNLTNIIPIHYTYVAPTYSSGKPNQTYHALEKILNGATIVTDGPEAALKVSCSPSVDVNDWYTDRNGTDELVSTKRLEGGFVNIVTSLNEDVSMRNQIKTDMLISSINRNEPENGPATVTIHGLIFNFRNEVMPVDYTVTNEAAMKSTSSSIPKRMSLLSLSLIKGWSTSIPGTLIDFLDETFPEFSTLVIMSPFFTSVTTRETRPSSIRILSPFDTSSPKYG